MAVVRRCGMEGEVKHGALSVNFHTRPSRESILGGPLKSWLSRRRPARLSDLDDRMLGDIGLSREALSHAPASPLSLHNRERLRRTALHHTVWNR
jgi:uncharacterized protein YjiS (DUF1127 family)